MTDQQLPSTGPVSTPRSATTGEPTLEQAAVMALSSPNAMQRLTEPQAGNDDVRAAAGMLFRNFDPTNPLSLAKIRTLPITPFFPRSILKPPVGVPEPPLDWALANAVTNGGRLNLQGEALGVGASTLASSWARSFNLLARERGDQRRVLYAPLLHGCTTVPKFLESLSLLIGSPMSSTELRMRSPTYLALRLFHAASRRGVTAIILDHVHRVPPAVRMVIAGLIEMLDPARLVPLEIEHDAVVAPRVSVIIVDHLHPEDLFREAPDVLLHLEGNLATLRAYRSTEQMADALRLASVGLDDLNLSDQDDFEVARLMLHKTSGLPSLMVPMLRLVHAIAMSRDERPSPAILEAALPVYRRMVDVDHRRNRFTGEERAVVRARRAKEILDDSMPSSERSERAPRTAAGARALRRKKEERALAEAEKRDMQRRATVTPHLPRPEGE